MALWKDSDHIVTLAEEATSIPPPPEGGIPKQRIPGWIRWPIRLLIIPFVIIDVFSQKFVRRFFKTPYRQVGGCNQRGNCCHYILFPPPENWLSKIFYFWNTEINGFFARDPEPVKVDDKDAYLVMGCRYLKPDGGCGNYRLRPAICRTWPLIEYYGRPRVLKGCGFKAVPRDKNFDPFPQEEEGPTKTNKLKIIK